LKSKTPIPKGGGSERFRMNVEFFINFTPSGQERVRKGKHGFYQPSKSANQKKIVQAYAQQAITKHGPSNFPISGPVSLVMDFYVPIPKSWSKTRTQQAYMGLLLPQVKPDIDNLNKLVMDALNKLVYVDDALICDKKTSKRYICEAFPNPGCHVVIDCY